MYARNVLRDDAYPVQVLDRNSHLHPKHDCDELVARDLVVVCFSNPRRPKLEEFLKGQAGARGAIFQFLDALAKHLQGLTCQLRAWFVPAPGGVHAREQKSEAATSKVWLRSRRGVQSRIENYRKVAAHACAQVNMQVNAHRRMLAILASWI